MRISRRAGLAAVAVTVAALAGCSNQLNDLGGIGQASPDYALTYVNVPDFPNVTILCIRGVGFATTTRTGVDLVEVPEWNAFCASKEQAAPRPAPSASSTPLGSGPWQTTRTGGRGSGWSPPAARTTSRCAC